jgi:stage V sporulation protein SpoVS
LPDDCARFVSVSSPGEAAEAIVSLLRDREAANAQADRAMRIADAWSIDAAARAYLAVYRDVVARHAGAPAPGTSSADPDVRWESLER